MHDFITIDPKINFLKSSIRNQLINSSRRLKYFKQNLKDHSKIDNNNIKYMNHKLFHNF